MRVMILILALTAALTVPVRGTELPEDVTDSLPSGAEKVLGDLEDTGPEDFTGGVAKVLSWAGGQVREVLTQRVRGAASILLIVVLCGAVEGFHQGASGRSLPFLPMAGALSVTLAAAGSLDTLIGLGAQTMEDLSAFSQALLPTLAAATAASGAVTTATFQQVATVFLVDLFLRLVKGVLLPLVYLYIGVLTASTCLPEGPLGAIAAGVKKAATWLLTTPLIAFTVYLSVVRVVSGTADSARVKVAKAAISGVVPVVGGIISEVSETVLAGAGLLRGTIGVFGMLAVLAACAYPFLQLGIQYLLYKLTAFLASAVGSPGLCKLIDGLGGAFGLVLGMTGACALLLLVSILASVSAVMP